MNNLEVLDDIGDISEKLVIPAEYHWLPSETADQLLRNIQSSPINWHPYAVQPGGLHSSVHYSDQFPKELEPQLMQSFQRGDFCYRFRRSIEHVPNCQCWWCEFQKNYLQTTFLKKLGDRLSQKLSLQETFVSIYSAGDFLSTHHDKNKGDYAFVLNLTFDWKSIWGGALHICGAPTSTAVEVGYNSLTVLDVSSPNGQDHYVSMVAPYVSKQRIAVTGWVSQKN